MQFGVRQWYVTRSMSETCDLLTSGWMPALWRWGMAGEEEDGKNENKILDYRTFSIKKERTSFSCLLILKYLG